MKPLVFWYTVEVFINQTCRVRFSLFFLLLLLVSFISPAEAGKSVIRILHMNDFHGFAEPHRPIASKEMLGGIAYLAAEADRLKKEKPSLLLAAGDFIQGNNWANLFRGKSSIEVMNAMRFDAMVPGNHEFDFGRQVLMERIFEANFPFLGANVNGLGRVMKPYIIRELEDVRVAIIGIVTDDTPITTAQGNTVGLNFGRPAETVERIIQELNGKADIILVLSHLGHANDRDLAQKVKGIDVIVGGHSHTSLSSPARIGDTIIVQAWEHAKALGVLDLTVEDGRITRFNWDLIKIKPISGKTDPQIERIVGIYSAEVKNLLGEKIGYAGTDLDGEGVRRRETNLGNFVADIIRQRAGADAAIINGGTLRTSLRKGEIRKSDIYSVLPFDNYIVAVKLTGRQIKSALEHGVSAMEKGEGRFPQVSGISFSYSASAPPGKRVREILVLGDELDLEKEYTVATHDFLAAGGDGYTAFGEAMRSSGEFSVTGGAMKGEKVVFSDSGKWIRDVVIDFILGKGSVTPHIEGRIRELP